MKKLFALTFVLLLSVGVMAQNDMYFFAGGEPIWDEVDPIPVPPDSDWVMADLVISPDKWFSAEIWGKTDCLPDIGMIGVTYALGIEYGYIDEFYTGSPIEYPPEYYPIYPPMGDPADPWTTQLFTNPQDDVLDVGENFANAPGFMSLSFIGVRAYGATTRLPFIADDPAPLWTYYVHAINDPTLIGETHCALSFGQDPIQGPTVAGSQDGAMTIHEYFACVYFSPNQPPIMDPDITYQADLDIISDNEGCGYCPEDAILTVTDVDGDAIVITGEILVREYNQDTEECGELTGESVTVDWVLDSSVQPDPEEDLMIYTYYFTYCGDEIKCGDLVVTINDGNNDPVTQTFTEIWALGIDGVITASMDDLWIYPGLSDWMPIYLQACESSCFCLGGFTFTVCFDPSILSVPPDSVRLGAELAGGEIWTVTWNIEGPGTIRFFFVNDMNNQEQVPLLCDLDPEVPIIEVLFLLDPGYQYPTNFCIPICFCEETYDDNSVSDTSGYFVWMPEGCDDPPDSIEYGTLLLDLECGNIKVIDECNIVYGDINLNGYPYEVGDVVLLANHLINPIAYPFTLRQMFASDVNGDGIQASIADLIYMIYYITNGGAGKVTPLDVVAAVSMPTETNGDVNVMISSEASVGGAIVSINHAGFEIGVPVAEGMDLVYNDNGEVMTVMVYSMEANSFAPGSNVLFTIPDVAGDLTFGDVSVSDYRGALLDARAELPTPLPTEFTVLQNYPNPFNAVTRINFTLPSDANVNINIYNVAGQIVESIDRGEMAAGYHSVVWNASDIASGIYFYRVVAGDHSETMKMTLLK